MAHTKFEYVKSFELEDKLEPLQWIVLEMECMQMKSMFTAKYNLQSGLVFQRQLANSAEKVMKDFNDIVLGYGYRNKFSFLFKNDTSLYNRRCSKLLSNVTSLLTSYFTSLRTEAIPRHSDTPIKFDSSIYLLPHNYCVREFFIKEQRLCHEINIEETCIYYLVNKAKLEEMKVIDMIKDSSESQKNEYLFSLCDINYNNEPVENKKGNILLRNKLAKSKDTKISTLNTDFKKDEFWSSYFPLNSDFNHKNKFINFELFKKKQNIIPHMFLVVRIDGKGFHKFSEVNKFVKPNDDRSLNLMTAASKTVFQHFPKMEISYGQSDEYSFIFSRYGHGEKDGYSLISKIVSLFTFFYIKLWESYFPNIKMCLNPSFDGRLIMYPTISVVRDYLCWRQADCHINNMYNTCFWKLVTDKRMNRREAQEYLRGTYSKDKLSILKNELNIEYNEDTKMHRWGTVIYASPEDKLIGNSPKVENSDILKEEMWLEERQLLQESRTRSKRLKENSLSEMYD